MEVERGEPIGRCGQTEVRLLTVDADADVGIQEREGPGEIVAGTERLDEANLAERCLLLRVAHLP